MQKTAEKKTTTKTTPVQTVVTKVTPIWNKVAFTGRLGKDPEMNYTPNGKPVTKFSIAVNQGKQKDAMWLDVVAWEFLAEQVNEETAKGTEVEVRGRLTQESWKDKEGKNRKAFKVVAETVTVLQGKKADLVEADASENDPLGNLEDHPF